MYYLNQFQTQFYRVSDKQHFSKLLCGVIKKLRDALPHRSRQEYRHLLSMFQCGQASKCAFATHEDALSEKIRAQITYLCGSCGCYDRAGAQPQGSWTPTPGSFQFGVKLKHECLFRNQAARELRSEAAEMAKKAVNQKHLWFTVSFTFLSCCFGSGLLSIPSIAVKMGFVPFLLLNAFAVGYTYFCLHHIVEAQYGQGCRVKTLTQLISIYFGKIWLLFMDLSIIFCLMPVSYIAVSADYFRNFIYEIFNVEAMQDNGWVVGMKFITCLGVMFPLTLIKTIKILNYVASLSLVFVLVSVVYVFIKFCIWQSTGELNEQQHPRPEFPWFPSSAALIPDVLTYITMFFSLYSMQASVVCIMCEYHGDFGVSAADVRKQIKCAVFYVAIPVAATVYTGYGLLGCFMFDQNCDDGHAGCIMADPNVLLSFTNDTASVVIELLFSIVVFVSFPVMLYPIRKSVLQFCKIQLDIDRPKDYAKYISVGLAITLVCLLIAVFLDDVSQIQSFTANLLGIILYALSGLMLWFARGSKQVLQAQESETGEDRDEQADETAQLLQGEQRTIVIKDEPRARRAVFWSALVGLVGLNVCAIGCQVYTWVR